MIRKITTAFFRITLLAVLAMAASCESDDTEPVVYENYFPLEVGRYAIYEVTETVYSSGQKDPVTKTWQEKDEIDRVTTSQDGMPLYTFTRSTRSTPADYWLKVKEFTAEKYPDKILTNIDNRVFYAMTFPVDPGAIWNGNVYNDGEKEDYYYEKLDTPARIGSQEFQKSLSVVERRDSSLIDKFVGIKQYALDVGLISDEQVAYEYCQNEACIGSGTIDSGTYKIRRIIEYGQN
ncbi:hypothetical protein [Dyadobacter sandarakinus]|uniref:DUF4377 domain-containing protein n=1 Tax=Dyadobacter sandarakinus TaxID=2747268 RepID=A0ABX7ICD9_9BACT|nr:hypothetical protein [Dyadobacter sandarakinus]QRR03488.1 hypothetical protein HWI92_22525 [Dyadobacter sandarakinus]